MLSRLIKQRIAILLAVVGLSKVAPACFYNSYEFNTTAAHQTTAYNLINERYPKEADRPKGFWTDELRRLKDKALSKGNDGDFLDDYAFVLYRTGSYQEAEKIWADLVKREPGRFSSLCNYATILQGLSRFDEAAAQLSEAIKIKPGFRNGAEELHLRMIEFQKQIRLSSEYGQKHLFVDEMTTAWLERKTPPKSFDVAKFPQVSTDGMAELLRAFPSFGDGWLVLGMLLEKDGDFHLARRSYERALRYGTSQRAALTEYMKPLMAYESEHNSVTETGRAIIIVVCGAVGLLVFRKFFRTGGAMINDLRQSRLDKIEDKKRRGRKQG